MIGYGPSAFRIARPLRVERRTEDDASASYPTGADGGGSPLSKTLAAQGQVPSGPSSTRALGEQIRQLAQVGGRTITTADEMYDAAIQLKR